MTPPPWETPLRDYVGGATVEDGHPSIEADGPLNLERVTRNMSDWPERHLPERPDLRFRLHRSGSMVVLDAGTGTVMGGQTAFYPYVLPPYRGQNLNALMNLLLDEEGLRRRVSSYTHEGFGSRVATHRLHLERALAAGHALPGAVLEDYLIAEGQVRLRSPYTAEKHNAWVEEQRRLERIARHDRETAGYVETFRAPDDPDRAFDRFGPGQDGHLLAIGLHREAGTGFLVHIEGATCLIQAERNGLVIDSLGVRPAEIALEDLIRRRLLLTQPVTDPFFGTITPSAVESFLCADEAELLARIGPRWEAFFAPLDEVGVREALESVPGRRALVSDALATAPALAP